jgi:hypothetical protein
MASIRSTAARGVVGIGQIAEDRHRHSRHRRLSLLDERDERGRVPAPGLLHEPIGHAPSLPFTAVTRSE